MSALKDKKTWQISVPIFKNPLIMKQLALVFGIPFGLLALILGLSTGQWILSLYILGILAGLLILTGLIVLLLYRGRYDAEFSLDDKGALCRTQTGQRKKNKVINTLAVTLGLLSGKPAVAGAGLLAQSRQEVFIRWKNISKVKFKPGSRTILIRSGLMESIALFCDETNYEDVSSLVRQKTGLG